jgi:hypothetical protein
MKKDIYNNLMEVANLFGGHAAKDALAAEDKTDSPEHMRWLEGRASGFQLVESHCKRIAAIYREEDTQ